MLDERKKRILIWGALGAVMLIIVLLAVLCGNPAEDTDLGNSSIRNRHIVRIPRNRTDKSTRRLQEKMDRVPALMEQPILKDKATKNLLK